MKKLTAGIFATILGLTAIDAYAAQVASTNYVQGAINSLATVAKTGAYDDLTGKPTIPSLDGYAKESWVEGKGYAVATQVAQDIATATTDMATKTQVAQDIATATTDMATKTQVAQDIATATTDMATQTWVGEQGYLKDANLTGYAKESWVEGKGYATTTEVNNLHEAQAQVIGVNQVAIKGLQDADTAFAQEQDAQDTEIAKKANSADVYTKTLADTTFVKVSDVVDTYVAN